MIELLIFYAGVIFGIIFVWIPMKNKIGFRKLIEKSSNFYDGEE